MNRTLQTSKYVIFDVLSSGLAWFFFFSFRKIFIEPAKFGYPVPMEYDDRFFYGLILIPLFWVSLYALLGMYKNIYRRHRLKELGQVMFSSIIGVIILFFTVLIDDQETDNASVIFNAENALFDFCHLNYYKQLNYETI